MSKQPRVSNVRYGCLYAEVEGFDSLAELALDMPWLLPMALVCRRTKKGERS
ncbi:MAG: hypothetical protein ACYC6Y_10965 [Thermoguttaceae bacterium]